MKLGTEDKKKTMLAVGLTAVALGTVYFQLFSEEPLTGGRAPSAARAVSPKSAIPPQARPARGVAAVNASTTTTRRRTAARRGSSAFEPIWRRSHEDDAFDALSEDPSLETARLVAVRGVSFEGVERNIFRFGERKRVVEAPPPAATAEAQRRQEEFAARAQQAAAAPVAAPEPARAGAPRLTWKYYGFASPSGAGGRRAFLLDGEDVLIASEGDVLKSRYKIVRVGLANVVIEDMQFNEEQSLAITALKK
jgi:hypothetical protein